MLHLVEWDLLLLASLDRIYGDAGQRGVALTGLTPWSARLISGEPAPLKKKGPRDQRQA